MSSTTTLAPGVRTAGGLVLAALLCFAWLSGLWNRVQEWSGAAAEDAVSSRPNILLIVADDLGYNDTSAINSTGLATPNLLALARDGVTFTRHYADSTCTPSRVAILTGRYPERSGFRPVGAEIPAEYPTIAERLGAAGYRTYLTGKWHAGEERREGWPQHKGFPQWFGFLNQFELAADSGSGRPTYHNPMLRENGGEPLRHEGHLTDILVEHTLEKIAQFRAREEPWFIYHAFLAPHSPIQPAQRYRSRFADTPAGAYEALVTQMDDAVGRLLDAVDPADTIVVFVSDNGGTNAQRDNNYPFHGRKNEPYEGAYRTPLIVSWPGRLPAGKFVDQVAMNVDIYPTLMAAAGLPGAEALDGHNLLAAMVADAPLPPRERGWETYTPNVGAMGFSYLTDDGQWRLASREGLAPHLYDLGARPSGDVDVAREQGSRVAALLAGFWRDHWRKSLVPVAATPGTEPGQTRYTGFDALRSPFRHGFAIGLEIGPLPATAATTGEATLLLARQEGSWELRYRPRQGVEWRFGDTVLTDASFDPATCNGIVLTGYLQPASHLAVRAPRSSVKLYVSGDLGDSADFPQAGLEGLSAHLDSPTIVNHGGRALFSNMALSSWAEAYAPTVAGEFLGLYTAAHRERSLVLADVAMLDSQLCRSAQ